MKKIIRRIINRKKMKIKKNKRQMVGGGQTLGERSGERFLIFFLIFVSFSVLRKMDRRFSSEQKAKLVYATRVTHRYQYLSLLSNFKRWEIFLLVLFQA